MNPIDKQFVDYVKQWRQKPDHNQILIDGLTEIKQFGFGVGCGRGYTCAKKAAEYLTQYETSCFKDRS